MDSADAILRALIRAWDKDRGWPPQDVADLMVDLRVIVDRARSVVREERSPT